MISLINLFEDIQQPPQQPGQPVQQQMMNPGQQPVQPTQQQMVNTGQQPDNQQKPGLWNKIKSGYNNINNKYESAVDATKNALFSPTALYTLGTAGMALMPYSPIAGTIGMGAMQAGRVLSTVKSSQQLANNARMQYQMRQQQTQQPR